MPPRCAAVRTRIGLAPGPPPSSDGVWITDTMLRGAIERYNRISSQSRHSLSSCPGPIESRRRLGKRHMTAIMPGSHFTPPPWSIEFPLRLDEWKWEPPNTPEDRIRNNKRFSLSRLLNRSIEWLENFDDGVSTRDLGAQSSTAEVVTVHQFTGMQTAVLSGDVLDEILITATNLELISAEMDGSGLFDTEMAYTETIDLAQIYATACCTDEMVKLNKRLGALDLTQTTDGPIRALSTNFWFVQLPIYLRPDRPTLPTLARPATTTSIMAPKKKIAVMTSGGDSPGMNAAVRAIVRMTIHMGCDAFCVYEGYEGLVQGGDFIRRMEWDDVRGWLSEGGTLIGTARCMAFYERPGRLTAAKNLVLSGIDALVICGGDGSLTGADKFRAEWPSLLEELISKGELTTAQTQPYKHLNIVGLVGSIDNDLTGTDATIGAYSALARICEMVDYIEATASSHSRAFVIEVMGRHCGWLALMAGVATGADFVFIPERPREHDWKEDMGNVVKRHRNLGKRKTIVIVAEGARDKNGTKITAEEIKHLLADKSEGGLALDTRITTLGHVQRGGTAVAYDRMLATLQGVEAVKAVLDATPDTVTPFIAINENKIVRKPLMEAVAETKKLAEAVDAKDFEKAMSLRDSEFEDQWKSYMLTTNVLCEDKLLSEEKRMRIGFINVGAPAGGMNAAVRAAVAYCLSRGHEPLAIHNGFAGFARHHGDKPVGSVRPFTWLEVDGWASKGGSEIGTNRELPGESGMELIANLIEEYRLDALFIVGGFEAFHSISQMRKARDQYPSLCIPMCLLPATISNNVPGTEYSLGSDTCLNELVNYCDKIKQSASATRRRVFVIETQGGRSGYVATLAGLDVGASAVYIPEEGISLEMLNADVRHLKEVFRKDKGQSRAGRLILVNEKASKVYSAKLIADIIREEAHDRFESRESIPGHVQQGGVPSPMDRCRAVRLAIKCMQHLEEFGCNAHNHVKKDPLSTVVIGIQGSEVVFSPMKDLEEKETDWPNRRPKTAHWMGLSEVVNILGGRPEYYKPEPNLTGLDAKDTKRGL